MDIDQITDVKLANRLEDVIEASGHKFERKNGKYIRVHDTGGLVINVEKQRWFWATKGQSGDVISWVTLYETGGDWRAAIESLCDRGHLPRPQWGNQDEKVTKAAQVRESVFDIAQSVFVDWLWKDDDALAYTRGRGWSDETIKAAAVGFSGRHTAAEYADMKGEFSMYGIELDCPQAVSILGFHGDVTGWAKAHEITPQMKWVSDGRIPAMMGTPGLVYGHFYITGHCRYMSRRQLPGHDTFTDENGKERKWKSYNPPIELMGERQPFYNQAYRADAEEAVVVEGPGDAISFGQWGFSSMATCGVNPTDGVMVKALNRLAKHQVRYVATDNDAAGQGALTKIAAALGPLTRLVEWNCLAFDEDENVETVTDGEQGNEAGNE